jgi:glyceraldehyde 3-phosphate dehydrogenase
MTINVGINGLGRIGRMVIRAIIESQNKHIKIKHINNRSNSEASCNLIKYDSVHGKFNADLDYDENHLIINKNKITFSQESKIEDINWKKFEVDYVFECTGKFNSKEKLLGHIKNGVKKVIANTLHKNFEIEKGFMTTIHAFTSDQRILDNSHKDPRRARSASQSIVPTSTGASKAIGEIIPSLKGKLEGVAMRVPTPNVSLIELVFCTKKEISKEKINDAFKEVSKNQSKRILEITTEKLVSIDFNHNSSSAIIDSSLTSVVGKNMGKISAWYDNEWGFSNRMCDIAEYVHKIS